jgi:hypothetical protein
MRIGRDPMAIETVGLSPQPLLNIFFMKVPESSNGSLILMSICQ